MRFPRLRIGRRLFLSFLLVLAVLGMIVGIAVERLEAVDRMANHLVNDRLARQQKVADWLGAVELNGARAMAIAKSDSLELEDYFMAALRAGDKQSAQLQAAAGSAPAERALLAAIAERQDAYLKLRQRIFELKAVGRTQDVERLAGTELQPAFERYTGAIRALLAHHKQRAAAVAAESAQLYRSSRLLLGSLGGLAIGLGILFAWLLTRSIVRPLKNAVVLAEQTARGRLDADIAGERHDEIGQLLRALQTMNGSLAQTIGTIGREADAVGAAASRMVTDNDALSRRTETQATTLEATAGSIEQITAAVAQNAAHAGQAQQLAESATELAGRGGDDIAEVAAVMRRLKSGSSQIADITSLIDGIAFQTNLLALNAAVEAARAGAHGRSFAVVASEVRTLAQRAAAAAGDIHRFIDGLIEQIHVGDKLAAAAGGTMERIVGASRQVAGIVGDIAGASHQQSLGVQQASRALNDMGQATQRNAAFVEHSAATAAGLQQQAQNLRRAIGFFTLPQQSRTAAAAEDDAATAQFADAGIVAQRPLPGGKPAPVAPARGAAAPANEREYQSISAAFPADSDDIDGSILAGRHPVRHAAPSPAPAGQVFTVDFPELVKRRSSPTTVTQVERKSS
ncbi:MAG: methyl-accepting chemotaxis protein [Burkholderiaceae bacterium]